MFGINKRDLTKAIFTPHHCTSMELDTTTRFAQKQHNDYLNQLKEEQEILTKRYEERRRCQ